METSKQDLVFLDTKVHLREGYLIPEIYWKPTDSHEYLHPKLCHPPQVAENIPYSVALRVRGDCSDRVPDDKMFTKNLVKCKAYLLESGYASDRIDNHFIKVAKLSRKDVVDGKVKCTNRKLGAKKINFVTMWDPMSPTVLGQKPPRQKPPGHKPPHKNPLHKNPPCQKPPRQNILFRNFITFVFRMSYGKEISIWFLAVKYIRHGSIE